MTQREFMIGAAAIASPLVAYVGQSVEMAHWLDDHRSPGRLQAYFLKGLSELGYVRERTSFGNFGMRLEKMSDWQSLRPS